MARLARKACCLLVGLFWLIPGSLNAAAANRELEGIRKKIAKEKQSISQAHQREGSILQALAKIENELTKKTKHLQQTQLKLDAIVLDLQKKEAEEQKLKASIGRRGELFQKRAVALYQWWRRGSPFILLSGELSSVAALLQRRQYLKAAVSFDHELIQQLTEEVRQQTLLRTELLRRRQELDEQKLALDQARQSFRIELENKKQLLASVRQETAMRVKALKELEQAALRLQKMMDEIAKKARSKPAEGPPARPMDARARFDWPVKGELAGLFGKSQHPEFSAEVFRRGIDIQAPLGDPIRAVEKGKVVYADRFAGYGNMIIIDHGDRFYTIYAHLAEIFKKNGDSVARGETVGRVGDSDSLAGAKLYFEMRKNGRSIDPLPWLRKQ